MKTLLLEMKKASAAQNGVKTIEDLRLQGLEAIKKMNLSARRASV